MTSQTAASRSTTSIVVRAIVVWAIALAGFQVIVRVFNAGNWAHIVRDLLLFRPTAEADSWEPIALSLAHLHAAGTHAFYAARYFATDVINGQAPRDYDELAARYAKVTPEAVRDLAKRLFESSAPAIVTLY